MTEETSVLRLAGPKKRGIFALLFSRVFIIVVLFVLQFLIAGGIFLRFRQYFPHYAIIEFIFTICMVIYLFNCGMDSSAKLTWLMLIAIFPLAGAIFLYFTKMNIGHRSEKARVEELLTISADLIKQDPETLEELSEDISGTDDLCRYLNRSGTFPVYGGTRVTYFPQGEDKFKAMLEELEKARQFIFMEYFIVEEGYMWGSILSILARKAKEGVDVRVMYDGMCEISLLPSDYPKRLEGLGIKAKAFSRLTPFLSTHYNYRDHRKILVIDGKCAFTGGVNLADEYINKRERFGHWKDTAVMMEGPAAQGFTLMFLQMWNVTEELPFFDKKFLLPAEPVPDAPGYVIPFGDIPLDNDKVGESVYMDILYRATSYVHIMTPYLILDDELNRALCYAAERGVDVKIILPGIPDKPYAFALAKSHYRSLVDSGVKVYEYTPGFIHAKVFVSDDEKAVVGTINLDYRSLYHHFECAAYLYRVPCIADVEKDFQDTLAKCRPVTEKSMANEKPLMKLGGSVLKLIAPLM